MPHSYSYFLGDCIFFIIWLILFLKRKDLRKKILTMSVLVAPLGPLSEFFYLRDYWHPELLFGARIGIEDILFAFFVGGISSVIYEEIFGKRFTRRHLPGHRKTMFSLAIFGLFWMVLGVVVFGYNSIYVSTLGFILIALVMLAFRHDLIKTALFSGFLMGCLMFVFYLSFLSIFPEAVKQWWLIKNISGILVLGIPLEELMWGFGWGMIAGPAYEFIHGDGLAKR